MSRVVAKLTPAGRCFALLTRAFPRRVTERYGDEMLDAFVRERDLLGRTEGRIRALGYSISACADVAREGLKARRPAPGNRRASGKGAGLPPKGPNRRTAISRLGDWLSDAASDVRFALRGLLRSPAFAVVAVLSLAVGIGVNTSLATIVNEVWLKPVPGVASQETLVDTVRTEEGSEEAFWTYPDFDDVRRADTTFEALAASAGGTATLTADDRSERVNATFVSANFFRTLGVAMSRGRDFLPTEDVGAGQHAVVVVSHDLWRDRLGGKDDIVGQVIGLNRAPYTVVGVAPADFTGARPLSEAVDLWVPIVQHPAALGPDSEARNRDAHWLRVVGRMRDGATIEETNASLQAVFAALEAEYPGSNENRSALVRSFGRFPAQNRYGDMAAVVALFVMVGLVLLIICGNVAGMVLARSATREQEIALRMALGSGRGRLVRQLMVEASLLSAAGGAAGIVLGFWISSFATPERLGVAMADINFEPSRSVMLFSIGLTAAATMVIGLFPALRFSHPQLLSSLKDDAGGGARRVGRIHRLAVSAQAAVALLLLVTFSLFARATNLVENEGFGFEPENLLLTRVHLSEDRLGTPEEAMMLLERLEESVSAVPGVASVSIADGIPLDLSGNFTRVSNADEPAEEGGGELVEFTRVGTGFFSTIGTSIMRGRAFEAGDDKASEPVAVVTEDLAEALWPGEGALGKRVRWPTTSNPNRAFNVVGVVGDVASSRASQDVPQLFVPLRQRFTGFPRYGLWSMLVIRGALDTSALVAPIQGAILDVDPTLPFPTIVTSESLVAKSTEPQRATANISAGLGLLALILCAIGVYGVVAFAVANRTREIGVRMAIGATRREVLRVVFADGIRLAVPGLVVGGAMAAGIAALLQSMLFGLSPLDPVSFLLAACVLLLVVLLASLVPARRAAGIDPMTALRRG